MASLSVDLLHEACKHGTEQHLELALKASSKADVNKLNTCEVTPLHLAVWRNSAVIVSRLLSAGADPNIPDGESAWTCLHKALYWGHFAVAALLIKAGASLDVQDFKGRTPLDLLSNELKPYLSKHQPGSGLSPAQQEAQVLRDAIQERNANKQQGHTDQDSEEDLNNEPPAQSTSVFCWGSGANYQLGTGSTDFALNPVRVEQLGELKAVLLVAAKYHSAAVSDDGRVWTWGWGRGGRLGHPDFNIHSGETALIKPWPVAGLGKRQVVSVAAGKHHMLVATSAGEVWSWGNNKYGKLGYGEADTQPTPKRVAAFQKLRIVAVAAAHKHSAALTSSGELYTWGANTWGQLGYGAPDSTCSISPRLVDSLKGKKLVAVSACKRHTVVLTSDGEPYTWGHQVVTPRRVNLVNARDVYRSKAVRNAAGDQVTFHKGHAEVMRPFGVAIAAGYTHTSVLTRTGSVLVWCSADPSFRIQEVQGALADQTVVQISASKTRTAVVTDTGDVYVWEAKAHTKKKDNDVLNADDRYRPVPGMDYGTPGKGTLSTSYGSRDVVPGSSIGSSGGMALAATALKQRSSAKQPLASSTSGYTPGPKDAGHALYDMHIEPVRVLGVKRVQQVAVGEKHTLALSSWAVPALPDAQGRMLVEADMKVAAAGDPGSNDEDEDYDMAAMNELFDATGRNDASDLHGSVIPLHHQAHPQPLGIHAWQARTNIEDTTQQLQADQYAGHAATPSATRDSDQDTPFDPYAAFMAPPEEGSMFGMFNDPYAADVTDNSAVPSLQVISQRVVATRLVDTRSVCQLLEYADAAGAALLRTYCMAVTLRNLDLVLMECSQSFLALPVHLLSEMEHLYKSWLQPGSDATADGNAAPGGMPGGSTPPLGSSPISGSWIEKAATSASRMRSVGVSDGDLDSAAVQLSTRRQQQLSKLQPPRRPTCVPVWLDGGAWGANTNRKETHSTGLLAHATEAALAAIGHHPLTTYAHDAATSSPMRTGSYNNNTTGLSLADRLDRSKNSQGDATFKPHANESLERAEEEAAKMARNIAKKLQQITALEERAAAAAVGAAQPLDPQQLAKISQKSTLTDALHALESGASVRDVQQLLNHAQEIANKLTGATDGPSTSVIGSISASAETGPSGRQSSVGPVSSSGVTQTCKTSKGGGNSGGNKQHQRNSSGGGGLDVSGSKTDLPRTAQSASSDQTRTQHSETGTATSVIDEASTVASGFHVLDAAVSTPPTKGADKSKKKAVRKGGLSMFLSGALDAPKEVAPVVVTPPVPKGPAWGGVTPSTHAASVPSLRELLDAPAPVIATAARANSGIGPIAQAARANSGIGPIAQAASANGNKSMPSNSREAAVAVVTPSRSKSVSKQVEQRESGLATGAATADGSRQLAGTVEKGAAGLQTPPSDAAKGRKSKNKSATPAIMSLAANPETSTPALPTPSATSTSFTTPTGKKQGKQQDVTTASALPKTPQPGRTVNPPPTPTSVSNSQATSSSVSRAAAAGSSPTPAASSSTAVKMSLGEFMTKKAKPATPPIVPPRDPSTVLPAWSAASSQAAPKSATKSAPVSGAGKQSLKDIQEEQALQRLQAPSWVSGITMSSSGSGDMSKAAAAALVMGSSPPSAAANTRWYVAEPQQRPAALQNIQTEEAAVKQIAKLYGGKNVTITVAAPSVKKSTS